jgi:Uma2 family endonuclease
LYTYGALALKKERLYTYEDYLAFDENVRCEIVNGHVYMMAAPSRIHQQILSQLLYKLSQFLDGKPCRVYPAPFTVVLLKRIDEKDVDFMVNNNPYKDETDPKKSMWVVEPDISVICDKSKYTKQGCVGAPDFIIEIVSPSSSLWDTKTKRDLYELNGVREYWTVDPETGRIIKRVLNEHDLFDEIVSVYTFSDRVPCTVLEGCEIDFSGIDLT